MPSDPTLPSHGLDAAAALLEWYAAMGVDVTLGDAPADRFEESAMAKAAAAEAQPPRRSLPVAGTGADRSMPPADILPPRGAAVPAVAMGQTAQVADGSHGDAGAGHRAVGQDP
jgi:hypothetical protein